MAVMPVCPSCGLESAEMRCPRCFTLKVVGCSGSCTLCKTSGSCDVPQPDRPAGERPAREPVAAERGAVPKRR